MPDAAPPPPLSLSLMFFSAAGKWLKQLNRNYDTFTFGLFACFKMIFKVMFQLVGMTVTEIRGGGGGKSGIFERKKFSTLTTEMESAIKYYSITLPIFDMPVHPQTTEIHSFNFLIC